MMATSARASAELTGLQSESPDSKASHESRADNQSRLNRTAPGATCKLTPSVKFTVNVCAPGL